MKALQAGIAILCLLFGSPASAQTYPSKPITIVVPFLAGGPADTLARLLAERMRNSLGQPIMIENIGNASGSTGVARVARSAPDGYTIGIGHLGTHVFNGAFYNLGFDLLNDLQPIAFLTRYHSILLSKRDVPASNLREFVDWLKENPEQATASTSGIGSVAHIGLIQFARTTGVDVRIIPYRGGAQALADVVAGHVTFLLNPASGAADPTSGGRLKAMAVAADKRLTSLPDVPTVDEAGLPGMYVSTWFGLWAPKGTPNDIVAKLNAATIEAINEPAFRKHLTDSAADIPTQKELTPEWLHNFQKTEFERWMPLLRSANIKVE